jgi:Flp pilus assembly protein TadD
VIEGGRAFAASFSPFLAMLTRTEPSEHSLARAIEHLRRNEPLPAEVAARQLLAADPSNKEALKTLAYSLHMQARHRESEDVYRALVKLEPSQPLHWMNVGTACRCDDRIDEALFAFAKAAALGADTADFYYNVALAHISRDDYQAARTLLERAMRLAPDDAEIRYRYAFCCYEALCTDEALAALNGWETLTATPDLAASAGQLLMKLGEVSRAETTVRSAALDADADPRATLTLVQVLERTNRTSEASDIFDQLRVHPAAASLGDDLLITQAQLAQRASQHELAVELLERVLAGCKRPHLTHFQQYPLARSLDALGRYAEAFAMLEAAHASQSSYIKLLAPPAIYATQPLSIAEYGCDVSDVARWDDAGAPAAADSPIFILGFPRSGTTLLEMVLDAHERLRSFDEQPFLQHALEDILAENVQYPEELALLKPAQLQAIRSKYCSKAAGRMRLDPGQRLVDKNPLNILRLAVIKRLFPNAKIILAIRHPCDVILSCFMQHFRAPDFALLCKDIPTLAAAYRKTFDFWYAQQAMLQADVLELRYEDLVNDFQLNVRRVLDFLGLPWDEAVLSPATRAQDKRFISTPSYSQVIQPINDRSVGRWRNYTAHFSASLPTLTPLLQRWNYPA